MPMPGRSARRSPPTTRGTVALEDVENLVGRPVAAAPGRARAKAEDALRKLLAAVGVVEE